MEKLKNNITTNIFYTEKSFFHMEMPHCYMENFFYRPEMANI